MPAIQHIVALSFLPSLFILLLSTPVWSNNSTMKDMMEDMGMTMPDECYTPPDLENIFIDACVKVFSSNVTQCESVWNDFANAFGFKDPNTVTGDDYNDYFNAVPIKSDPNTVIFWSSVMSVIEEISKNPDISSSANQDSSSIINAMRTDNGMQCWCGNETHIIDTVNPCPMPGPTTVFWEKFSCSLAESASGISFWVGNGDRTGGAYQSNSFFANYEFPKLTADRVNRLVVIDIFDCDSNTGEKCDEGTLAELQNQAVEKYGNTTGYQCYEVCGNLQDKQQVPSIANNALGIIREEQGSK